MAMLGRSQVEEIAVRWAPAFTDVQLDAYTNLVDQFCAHTGLSPWQVVTVGGWLCANANVAGDAQSPSSGLLGFMVAAAAIRTVEQGFD